MAKEKENFTVTDRRLFTADGELRKDASEEESPKAVPPPTASAGPSLVEEQSRSAPEPEAPSAAEQKQQADAYSKSSKEMDRQAEISGVSMQDAEITFERFLASLYMTGMLQLGLMHEQGAPPQLDLIGARQTIDSLSLLSEKTKGNLTAKESNLIQNALYELRMAYVEVTNAIAKGPQPVPAAK